MSRRSRWTLTGITAASVVLLVVGCADSVPTVPTITGIEMAKGGGDKDPTVREAVPDSGFQGESMEVIVVGSGFDEESSVKMFVTGDPSTSEITTVATTYVSTRELRATINIAAEAATLTYDIEVKTSRDKKGIGSEMFRVRKKVNGQGQDFLVTSFRIEQISDTAEATGRCPDPANPCNKLTLEFTGALDSIVFYVAPKYEDLYRNADIVNSHLASGYNRSRATDVIGPVSHGLVVAYWQGQWRPKFWVTPMGPAYWDSVETIPNLDLVRASDLAAPDHFRFSYAYAAGTRSYMGAGLPDHDVVYTGWEADNFAYAKIEVRDPVTTPGRGKKKPGRTELRIAVQTFKDSVIQDRSTTLHAYSALLFTEPTGVRSFLHMQSHGIDQNDPDGLHERVFRTEALTVSGCHEARIIGVDSYPGTAEFYDDRFYVWDRSKDAVGTTPVGIYLDAAAGVVDSTTVGGCGS